MGLSAVEVIIPGNRTDSGSSRGCGGKVQSGALGSVGVGGCGCGALYWKETPLASVSIKTDMLGPSSQLYYHNPGNVVVSPDVACRLGDGVVRTFAKLMAPFLAPAKARVERKLDRANILGKAIAQLCDVARGRRVVSGGWIRLPVPGGSRSRDWGSWAG